MSNPDKYVQFCGDALAVLPVTSYCRLKTRSRLAFGLSPIESGCQCCASLSRLLWLAVVMAASSTGASVVLSCPEWLAAPLNATAAGFESEWETARQAKLHPWISAR
eukprot:TRINITY_DN12623_c0_g4_i2.p1 TRINITY_DN12623_c0_g4~~TRINITY_DN12623_c0_g4_i2.p1  ORF type:complete len:107 (-),score=6.53 TRINITY_DN12623_c0_g4_i2:254-574(-)